MAQISAENTLSTLKASLIPYREDRLSNLPNDVLNHVLVCLPIRDLVRTSILSRKWRYAWSSVPDLIFDRECQVALNGKHCLLNVVDRVLLLHSAPIRRFQISNCLNGYGLAHVDRWIVYLARNGIEELHLQFYHIVQNIYKMSSCLFSCKQLRVLVLCCYELMVPHTYKAYMMNLVYIDLKVAFLSEASISFIVSCCPLLETLKLQYRNDLSHLKFSAEKLKSLRVRGSFKNISLDGCSQLTDCKIYLLGGNPGNENEFVNIHNFGKVLGCLPLLEELAVENYFLRFLSLGNLSQGLVRAFEHLKFLHLNINFQDSKEISLAVCILRSSPKLETIEILVDRSNYLVISSDDPYNWVDMELNMECAFYKLKKIRIMNSMCVKPPQIEFLKFFLINAPILETMHVTVDKEAKAEKSMILKSLLLFPRASAQAKVVYEE